MKKKIIRVAAVGGSLGGLLKGQLRFLDQHYEVVGVASLDGGALENLAQNQGIRTIAVDIDRNINLLSDVVALYNLYRIFKREKPFMVHSITPKAGLLSMVAAYCARVPRRVHTFTGLLFPTRKGFMKRLLLFLDKVICYCATNVYPEGNGVKNDLINYKVTKKPLKVIGNGNVNGVDLQHFDPNLFDQKKIKQIRQDYDIKDSDFVFVFIGRLVTDKGIKELIDAFCTMGKAGKNAKLLLIGHVEGESDQLPKKTWQKINTHKSINYIGVQRDVRPFLAISDALAFPSYREGFPNVVLEAGAMGLPAIVTNINGCNEIIEHGNNGLIIPPKDVGSLLNSMIELRTNKILLQKLADNARPMIASRFERSYVWSAILEEYRRIEAC